MPRVLILGSVVLVIAGIALLLWVRSNNDHHHGELDFRAYVRDPALRSQVQKSMAAQLEVADSLAEGPPRALVEMLLGDNDRKIVTRAISRAGPDVVPPLIDAVSDPRFRRTASETRLDRPEPLVTVLACLVHYAPEESLPSVAPLVRDHNRYVRQQAARLCGVIGSDAAIEPLIVALQDKDVYVRSSAIYGVLRAMKADRATPGFRDAAFAAMQPLVNRRTVRGEAPKCLLALDRERAIAFLTSSKNMHADQEGLQYTLRALREGDIPVNAPLLLDLLSQLEAGSNDRALCEVLLLLGRVDSEQAREAIDLGMASSSQMVREAAAGALAASHGIEEPFRVPFDLWREHGWEGLNETQRHATAVRILINEVNNGGIAQYFVNSYGANWRDAVAGLEAIGADGDLAIVQQAISMFGAGGPSKDDEERHRQLSRIVEEDDEIFSSLEDAFYEDKDDREVLLLRFVVDHASDFTPPRTH